MPDDIVRSRFPRARSPAEATGLVGKVLSERYRIEALLGEGGMGAVYLAEHVLMHKRLAVKVLHPEMTRMPEIVARFEREAMAAAHIEHPNVAAATDFGKLDDGSFFLVLEYVEGTSLRDLIAHGPLDARARAAHRVPDRLGARARARARHRAPRSEARERHARRARRRSRLRQGARLRHRQGAGRRVSPAATARRRRRAGAHAARHGVRHAGVHGARAGARRKRSTRAPISTRSA